MPVYNEATVVRGVIEELVALGLTVIAVDDGSSDTSADEIDAAGGLRVSHPINLGQGGALQTGFEAALRFTDAKYVATFDSDGQHQAADLLGMIKKAEEGGYDVVLGSRFLDGKTEMSRLRRLILKTATKVFNRGSAHKLTDAHNGLRLVTRDVAARVDLAFARHGARERARAGPHPADLPADASTRCTSSTPSTRGPRGSRCSTASTSWATSSPTASAPGAVRDQVPAGPGRHPGRRPLPAVPRLPAWPGPPQDLRRA